NPKVAGSNPAPATTFICDADAVDEAAISAMRSPFSFLVTTIWSPISSCRDSRATGMFRTCCSRLATARCETSRARQDLDLGRLVALRRVDVRLQVEDL